MIDKFVIIANDVFKVTYKLTRSTSMESMLINFLVAELS